MDHFVDSIDPLSFIDFLSAVPLGTLYFLLSGFLLVIHPDYKGNKRRRRRRKRRRRPL